MSDPRSLTLELAYRSRGIHGSDEGRCSHCRVSWPCEAAVRVRRAILALSPRVIGRAHVRRDASPTPPADLPLSRQ